MDDNLNYNGPSDKITPPIGNNNPAGSEPILTGVNYNPQTTLPALIAKLNSLQEYIADLEKRIEDNVGNYILPIPQDGSNTKLQDAQNAAWPQDLGSPPSYVSYGYYKALSTVDSAASSFIQNSYVKGMRDVGGTAGLDYLTILDLMDKEIDLLKGFIEQYVGNLDDSSEHRVMELFDTWASSARIHAQTIDKYLSDAQNPSQVLPADEVQNLTPDEAQQSQAVFKVKLNSLNGEIASSLDLLYRHFSQYADLFYSKFLGPALKFRLDVSRKVYPKNSTIGLEVWNSSSALNANISVSIADQLRRVQFFDKKMSEIENLILMRDTYSHYITQVAPQAGPVLPSDNAAPPASIAGTVIDSRATPDLPTSVAPNTTDVTTAPSQIQPSPAADSAEMVASLQEFVKKAIADAEQANAFVSPHNALGGRTDLTAHPQYIQRPGDGMEGPLHLGGGLGLKRLVIHKAYTTKKTDVVVVADKGTFKITLGNLNTTSFQIISNEGSGKITIIPPHNKKLNGVKNGTILLASKERNYFYCDGAGNWWTGVTAGGTGGTVSSGNIGNVTTIVCGSGSVTW